MAPKGSYQMRSLIILKTNENISMTSVYYILIKGKLYLRKTALTQLKEVESQIFESIKQFLKLMEQILSVLHTYSVEPTQRI